MQPFPNLLERMDLKRLYPDKHGDPVFVHCPFHGDKGRPNMAVYNRNAYCFTCRRSEGAFDHIKRVTGAQSKMDVLEWAQKLQGAEGSAPMAKKGHPAPIELEESLQSYVENLWRHPERVEWLGSNYGISPEGVKRARIGHTGYSYVIPVYGLDGKLLTFKYRTDPKRFPGASLRYYGIEGYRTPSFYFPPGLVSAAGEVEGALPTLSEILGIYFLPPQIHIVEGEFDALALWGAGLPAISLVHGSGSLLMGESDELIGWLGEQEVDVYLMYDQDSAGRGHSIKTWRRLREAGVPSYVVRWPRAEGKDGAELVTAGYRWRGERTFRSIFDVRP